MARIVFIENVDTGILQPARLSSKLLGPEVWRGQVFKNVKEIEDLDEQDLADLASAMNITRTSKRETAEMIWLRSNGTQTIYLQTFEQAKLKLEREMGGKKATKRTPKSKTAKKAPREARGRPSEMAGKKIYLKVEENPRRKGTAGHKSFALIKNGMTVDDFVALGGRLVDLRWDAQHKYVEVK